MIVYSVTISVDADVAADWLTWMQAVHIPDVVRAGGFEKCELLRSIPAIDENRANTAVDQKKEETFVINYTCRSLAELEAYRTHHAPRLQKEHSDRYAGKFRATRMVLAEV